MWMLPHCCVITQCTVMKNAGSSQFQRLSDGGCSIICVFVMKHRYSLSFTVTVTPQVP